MVSNVSEAVPVARGGSYLLLRNLSQAAIGVVGFMFLVRMITKTEIGVYASLLVLTTLLQILGSLGFRNTAIKYIAGLIGKDSKHQASSVAYQIIRVNLIIPIISCMFLTVFSRETSILLYGTYIYSDIIRIFGFYLIFATLIPVFNGILLGLRKIREIAILSILESSIRWFLIVFLLIMQYRLIALAISHLIASIFYIGICLIIIYRSFGGPKSYFNLKELLLFSWPLYLSEISLFAYGYFDRLLILTLLPLDEFGTYSIVTKAYYVLYGLPQALAFTLFPYYSYIREKGGIKKIQKAVKYASRYIALTIIPTSMGFAALSVPLIAIFAGENYLDGALPMAILGFFMAITCIGFSIASILIVLEKTLTTALTSLIAAGSGLLLGLPLTIFLGITGAALGKGIVMFTNFLLLYFILKKDLKFKFDIDSIWKSLLSSSVMAAIIIIIQFIFYNKFLLPVYFVIGIIIYFSMLRILHVLRESDILLFTEYLGIQNTRFKAILFRIFLKSN